MSAKHLFEHLSPEVAKEMMRLAGQNWRGTGYCLPDLQFAAGQPDLAEKSLRQQLGDGEHKARGIEAGISKESRRALLLVRTARATLAAALQHQGKHEEADSLYLRAIESGEKTLGHDHPDVATRLNNRAGLLTAQGGYEEAAALYERSFGIRESVLGPDHPAVATTLNRRSC